MEGFHHTPSSWSDGSSLDSNTNLCSGMYNITVTDDNGCIISDSIFNST